MMGDFDEIKQNLDLMADEELTSILRGHDEEQWRPEVFDIVRSILQARGITPDEDPADEQDMSTEPEGLDLVTVGSYTGYMDAETDCLALEAKGLRAWVSNKYAPAMQTIQQGVQLRVLEKDANAAMAILESEPAPSSDLPEEIAEPPCPKCGSRNVTEAAELVGPSAESGGSSTAWLYHCASCGYKWSET
jgi:DNA-directed RNA polymerase subunit M/transcription elongation factor TFIIS